MVGITPSFGRWNGVFTKGYFAKACSLKTSFVEAISKSLFQHIPIQKTNQRRFLFSSKWPCFTNCHSHFSFKYGTILSRHWLRMQRPSGSVLLRSRYQCTAGLFHLSWLPKAEFLGNWYWFPQWQQDFNNPMSVLAQIQRIYDSIGHLSDHLVHKAFETGPGFLFNSFISIPLSEKIRVLLGKWISRCTPA